MITIIRILTLGQNWQVTGGPIIGVLALVATKKYYVT